MSLATTAPKRREKRTREKREREDQPEREKLKGQNFQIKSHENIEFKILFFEVTKI